MKKEQILCDIQGCKNEVEKRQHYSPTKMQVIFTTEQNEGRSTEPHLEFVDMDICKRCSDDVVKGGRYIQAEGAQGFNIYTIPKGHK